MRYSKVDLSGPTPIGKPGPLPQSLAGLSDETLRDLSQALDPCPPEYEGFGFWPVVVIEPDYAPPTQRLSAQFDYAAAGDFTVTETPLVVNKTEAELASELLHVKEEVRREVDRARDDSLAAGFRYDFGTAVATLPDGTTAPAGSRLVQTAPQHVPDWLAVHGASLAAVVTGQGDAPYPTGIRTADNAQIALTFAQALAFTTAMHAGLGARHAHSWTIKNLIDQAQTAEEIETIRQLAGNDWPDPRSEA